MNIIEAVRSILQSFPKISEMTGGVKIDFADDTPQSCGLSSTGDTVLSEDIIGNLTKQHSFMFYAVFSSINDYERLVNSSALIELGDWLRERKNTAVTTVIGSRTYKGKITSLRAENGMIEEIPESNGISGVIYSLQLIAEYTVEKE